MFEYHTCRFFNRYEARFTELRFPDREYAVHEIYVRPVESNGLAWSKASGNQQSDQRRIGLRPHARTRMSLSGLAHEQFNLLFGIGVRRIAASAWCRSIR